MDISDVDVTAPHIPPRSRPRAGHVRSLSGTLEEINASAALDVEASRLPGIYDPPVGVQRVKYEAKRCVNFAKTQSWLPTALVFLGVVLLIAVPSVSLLSARHTSGNDDSIPANSTGINQTAVRRALLGADSHESGVSRVEEAYREGWSESTYRPEEFGTSADDGRDRF